MDVIVHFQDENHTPLRVGVAALAAALTDQAQRIFHPLIFQPDQEGRVAAPQKTARGSNLSHTKIG